LIILSLAGDGNSGDSPRWEGYGKVIRISGNAAIRILGTRSERTCVLGRDSRGSQPQTAAPHPHFSETGEHEARSLCFSYFVSYLQALPSFDRRSFNAPIVFWRSMYLKPRVRRILVTAAFTALVAFPRQAFAQG